MRKLRKRAIYKSRTGRELKRGGIYFDIEFENTTELEVDKTAIRKEVPRK